MNLYQIRIIIYSFLTGMVSCLSTIFFSSLDTVAKYMCIMAPLLLLMAMALEWWEKRNLPKQEKSA